MKGESIIRSNPVDVTDNKISCSPSEDIYRSSRDQHGSKLKGRSSRQSSPSREKASLPEPDLLTYCVSVIASVISEDCRFQISSPRPSRPPNSLQSAVLDVAGYLLHMHRNNPKALSQIAFALLPAFRTFKVEMHLRLLSFFNDFVISPILEILRQARGSSTESESQLRRHIPY